MAVQNNQGSLLQLLLNPEKPYRNAIAQIEKRIQLYWEGEIFSTLTIEVAELIAKESENCKQRVAPYNTVFNQCLCIASA